MEKKSVAYKKACIYCIILRVTLSKKVFVCANKSKRYCLYVKKKTSCVSLSIYIFSRLRYKMKDEIKSQNSLPTEVKEVFISAIYVGPSEGFRYLGINEKKGHL